MRLPKFIICTLFLALCAYPASAFTISTLSIDVGENGDCTAVFDYSMNFIEYIGYYTHIANPAEEVKKEISSRTSQQVDVVDVSDKGAEFKIYSFADTKDNNGSVTYTVPSLNFSKAEEVLKDHWISKITSFDLSPEVTTITFPDGYIQEYDNEADIPQTVHTVQG
ncbi:hypothetical protein J2128_000408 [Methanomicrobium sp. W14]|uniref:hypothetical protein n=1 Tax=Methanomicrobium sp. W14 TaxID=2817839 RepID=UPI001AE50122|nr:hypothetical protein [Methanomicrobium sp. W14]MBP2132487.1 hypothetical protein [Methanomicrobium sp. W14]